MSEDYNTGNFMSEPTLPLIALLESLLFVADGPVPVAQFATALDATPRAVESALEELEATYQVRGLRIQRDKSGIQLTTAPQAAEAVEKFLGLESLQRLSRPSVETLAIIAYQQPVTRPYIESIRGVNSDGVIKSLLTKGLIEEVGRTEGPGRPVLYATTSAFLQHFGLTSLQELPPLDIESLLAAAKVTAEQNAAQGDAATPEPASQPEADGPVAEAVEEVATPEITEAAIAKSVEGTDAPAQGEAEPDVTVIETVVVADTEGDEPFGEDNDVEQELEAEIEQLVEDLTVESEELSAPQMVEDEPAAVESALPTAEAATDSAEASAPDPFEFNPSGFVPLAQANLPPDPEPVPGPDREDDDDEDDEDDDEDWDDEDQDDEDDDDDS